MSSLPKRAVYGAVLTTAVLGFTACSDGAAPLTTETGTTTASAAAPTQPANERLAQLVALSMRDASVRGILHRSFAASNEYEGKVFLGSYLRGEGAPLLRAMSRATGTGEGEILALLDQTGPMEMYLPVEAHRAAWKGGNDIIVATLMVDHTVPAGFDLNGKPVMLSKDTPPAIPTISIVPAEGFSEAGVAHRTRSDARAGSGASFSHTTVGTPWTGLWVNEVHTTSDFEGWALGNAEFELYMQDFDTRQNLVCANEVSIEPYRWDLNGKDYYSPFLIAAEGEIPQGVTRTVALYEDDDGRCVIRDEKDFWRLAADALTAGYSTYKAIKDRQFQDGQWVVHLSNVWMNVKSLASGNDEFVGVSAGLNDVGSSPEILRLKDPNGNNQGYLVMQYKTDVAH